MIVVVIGKSLLVLFVILFPAPGYGKFHYHWRYYAPVPGYGELQILQPAILSCFDEYHGNIRVTGTIFSIKVNLQCF